jgi:hypothetical protein
MHARARVRTMLSSSSQPTASPSTHHLYVYIEIERGACLVEAVGEEGGEEGEGRGGQGGRGAARGPRSSSSSCAGGSTGFWGLGFGGEHGRGRGGGDDGHGEGGELLHLHFSLDGVAREEAGAPRVISCVAGPVYSPDREQREFIRIG